MRHLLNIRTVGATLLLALVVMGAAIAQAAAPLKGNPKVRCRCCAIGAPVCIQSRLSSIAQGFPGSTTDRGLRNI